MAKRMQIICSNTACRLLAMLVLCTSSPAMAATVDLSINKTTGPAVEVRAGENFNYLISVNNAAGADASTAIVVTDVLPAGTEYVSANGADWSCSYDAPTRTVSCTLAAGLPPNSVAEVVDLTVTSTEGGSYENTATVDAPDSIDTDPSNNTSSTTRIVVPVTGIEINKLINNGNPVDGEAIVFTLLLTNNGPSTATDITVSDPVPPYVELLLSGFDGISSPDNGIATPNGGSVALTQTGNVLQWDISKLDPGETVALTIDATYQRATTLLGLPIDDGIIENTATVLQFGSYGLPVVLDPDLQNNIDTATVGAPEADVSISKIATLDPTAATPVAVSELDRDASFSYVIDVTNNGPSSLQLRQGINTTTDLQVIEMLPAGVSFVDLGATDLRWNCSSAGVPVTITCDYVPAGDENLASGQSLPRIVVNVIAPSTTGDLENTVAVSYTNSETPQRVDNNSVNDRYTLVTPVTAAQADLSLSKAVDNASPAIGDTVTFTIAIDNVTGPADATNIQVSDELPAGLTLLGSTASQGSYNGGVWSVGDLPFGASATLQIQARVDNPERITNIAEITSFDQEDPTSEGQKSAAVDVPDADLELTKTVTAAPVAPDTAPLTVGQQVEFTVTLANNGSVDGLGTQLASNVVVTDTLPAGLSIVDPNADIVASAGTATYDGAANTISWSLPAIGPGTANDQTLIIRARVDTHAELVNSAAVTASDLLDADTANNSDTATADVIRFGPLAGSIVINEVLTRTVDGNDQFVEISNISAGTVSLDGLRLVDGNLYTNDTDGASSLTGDAANPAYVFPAGASLAGGEYAVIWVGANLPTTQAPEAAFQAWIGAAGSNLAQNGDELWLIDGSQRIIDYVAWGSGNELNTPPPATLNAWDASAQATLTNVLPGQSLSLTPDSVDGNSSACWEATTSGDASARCAGFLPTINADTGTNRVSSAGSINNGVASGVSISGTVYSDADHNAQFDDGEAGIAGVSIVLHDTVAATCRSVQTEADGHFEFFGVANGDYMVIQAADETVPVPAVCPPTATAPTGHLATSAETRLVSVTGTTVPEQNFGNYNGSVVTGTVFEDNGAGAATAYDGSLDADETATSGINVTAFDGATAVDTAQTDGTGGYALWVPAGTTSITIRTETPSGSVSVSENTGNSGALKDANLDEISFGPVAGTRYSGLDFGDAPEPSFTPDHQRTAVAGTVIFYPHTFTAKTTGDVTFTIENARADPDISEWNSVLLLDNNCDGLIDDGDTAISGPLSVDANAASGRCLLVKVTVPTGAPRDAQYQLGVQASMAYSGSATPDHISLRTDLTVTGDPDEAGLQIIKSVDLSFARPGEILNYIIIYRNGSREQLDNIVVHDMTPSFTTFVVAACELPLPASLASCQVTTEPAAGATGSIEWTLTGTLDAGKEGKLIYQVQVDN